MIKSQSGSNSSNHGSGYGRANAESLKQDNRIHPSTRAIISTQNKRILIVDDNSDTILTLRIGLERSDDTIQVFGYDNPVNALMDFKPNFYDLLLVDINMPLMDGFELCKKLLQKDINIKVCFMTSGEINMDAVREVHPLKSIGCFIKKPITIDVLIKHIKAELD